MAEKITQNLYGGAVKIDFYPNSHRYKLHGEKGYLISVTSALSVINKPALIKWALDLAVVHIKAHVEQFGLSTVEALYSVIDDGARQHEIRKEAAASIGSQVHEWAERFVLAQEFGEPMPEVNDEMDEKVLNGIGAFVDWYKSQKIKYHATEQIVYSKRHGYVGMADGLAEINGELTVIDYKTSKGIYNEMRYQVAAYWAALEEEHGKKINQALVIKFDKETGNVDTKYLTREDLENDFQAFLGALALKKREKELYEDYKANL